LSFSTEVSNYNIVKASFTSFCQFVNQARVVGKVDNTIHWINHYPPDGVVCFLDTYPLDSYLSGGKPYPAFEQLKPGW